MPRKTVVIDYKSCEPDACSDNGVCPAMLVCEKKIITQEAPYEMPDVKASMCLSCATCAQACPQNAIKVM